MVVWSWLGTRARSARGLVRPWLSAPWYSEYFTSRVAYDNAVRETRLGWAGVFMPSLLANLECGNRGCLCPSTGCILQRLLV
jgi:hypothetical protein